MDSEFDVPENNITDEMLSTYTDTVDGAGSAYYLISIEQ